MMTGHINADDEAILSLTRRGPDGQSVEAECVIDTGYNGTLALSPELVQALGLPLRGSRAVTMADVSQVLLGLYQVTILWDGEDRTVQTLEADGGSVIGMALLRGYRLTMDVEDGGSVTLESRSP